jgi:hypothetical protein
MLRMFATDCNKFKMEDVMPELVKIPAATAEVVARFDRPYIGLLASDRAKVFEALVSALLPFNFRFANTEIISGGNKPAEEKVVFRIPERGIIFQFAAEEYRFTKDGATWAIAEEDGEVWNAAETALLTASGAKIAGYAVTLALHIVPLSKTRDEVIAPFISAPFKQFSDQQATAFGAHIRFAGGGEVLFDYSLGYANGIFLRLSSQLDGKPPIPEVFARIRHEEEQVLKMLDL